MRLTRIFFILFSSAIIFYIAFQPYENNDDLVTLTYIIISLWSIFAIFNRRNLAFSLYKIFYTFALLFFGIAPFLQYSYGIVFWKMESSYQPSTYTFTNIIVLFILSIFEFCYILIYKGSNTLNLTNDPLKLKIGYKFSFKSKILLFSLTVLSLWLTLYSKKFNLIELFARSGDFSEGNQEVTPFDQVINNFFRPMSLMIFIVYYYLRRKIDVLSIIFLIIGMFCNFPSGLARYNSAALYIPLLLVLSRKIRIKYNFNIVLVFGFLFVFPFLNNFRYVDKNTKLKYDLDFEMFNEGHFDSYSSLLRVLNYDITTNGNQLIGVLLFWIPRSLWSTKPVGSGVFLADRLNLYWSNIAVNFFAEGYINFGFAGLLVFTIAFGTFCAKLDSKFNLSLNINTENNFPLFYFFIVGFLVFILRGDLLSSFAYLIGFMASVFFILKVISATTNRSSKSTN